MSVNSAMTAIADKIRAILGISGTMGLNAMSTNLGTMQTNLNSAYTAIGNKGGTVPSSKVSGNLATAINSIPAGATVQIKRGSFTSSVSGTTVNCGFKPDFVAITADDVISIDGYSYFQSAAFTFSEYKGYDYINSIMYLVNANTGSYNSIADIWAEQTDNGFFAAHSVIELGSMANVPKSQVFNYVAVKYT